MILNGECGVFNPRMLEHFVRVQGELLENTRVYEAPAKPQANKR